MANRLKEDEKNERVIRGLLKLPENRRCINCNSLGPQYVCTNFWTFVCTTCSGIHREFTHRVKSISMAKFTSQEVNALQVGGNQQAKEIYFKEWDSQRSVPDSSNVERLRDFIKHVYVDKRFTGERNYDKPPRVKMGEKEDFYDNQRPNSYQGGSRSPQYEDIERRYSNKSSPGGSYDGHRSPGYDQESRKYGNQGRSPSRPEFVSDWRRDDRFGNGKRDEDDGRSLERPKDLGSSSPPVVRPVRDILGENTVPLRISEPPKPVGRAVDVSSQTQGTASLSSLGSTNEKPVEVKLESAVSLIDFDAEPEHPAAPAAPQPQQSIITQSTTQPVYQNNDNNWASFDAIPQTKLTQSPNLNPLESVLSELSIMAPISGHASGIHGKSPPVTASIHTVASVSNTLTFPLGAAPVAASGLTVSGGNSYFNISGAGQGLAMQPQQASLFPYTGNQSTMQQFTPVAGPSSNQQPWNFSPAQSMQGFLNTSTAQASQPFADVKSRKELPEDIFTTTYSAFPAKVPGWQMGPPGGMGFPMQYNNTSMPMSTFQQLSKSTNPFDFSSESSPVQAPTLPSMASMAMLGVLPNTLPQSGLMRTSSLGTPSSAWMPQPSSYTLAFPQAPPYASAMPPPVPRAHMGQQVVSNMPLSRHQGVGSFRAEGTSFNSVNVDQQLAGRFSAPTTPSPFSSVGGNPFG